MEKFYRYGLIVLAAAGWFVVYLLLTSPDEIVMIDNGSVGGEDPVNIEPETVQVQMSSAKFTQGEKVTLNIEERGGTGLHFISLSGQSSFLEVQGAELTEAQLGSSMTLRGFNQASSSPYNPWPVFVYSNPPTTVTLIYDGTNWEVN
ncbi:MAG: hypothetical protein KDD67_16200 [Ignavibacteriae bacterium]|nr:hypothetical protein [Ignavibacteriota bacterium]MCB9216830.1 hypothetical protein [Ignavibacteria bacterium]